MEQNELGTFCLVSGLIHLEGKLASPAVVPFNNYLVLLACAGLLGPTRADSLPVTFEQFYIRAGVPGSQVRQSKHLTSWNLFIRLEGTD